MTSTTLFSLPGKFRALLTLVLLFSIGSASAEYVLTAPPREDPEQGQALYGKLAEEIGRQLNTKVTYEHPGSWSAYKKKMQSRKYDFVFDGPHFAAWRMENLKVSPLVKLPGSLSFVLVARADNDAINAVRALEVGKKVCVLPSPNLGTLSAYAMFPNQMRQPMFVPTRGGFKSVMKKFNAGKCDAALLREGFFKNKLDEDTRKSLKVLAKSKALTNQGITISDRIEPAKQKQLLAFLTSEAGQQAAQSIFNRFSKKNATFIPANKSDYKDHNMLVDNMVFGW